MLVVVVIPLQVSHLLCRTGRPQAKVEEEDPNLMSSLEGGGTFACLLAKAIVMAVSIASKVFPT